MEIRSRTQGNTNIANKMFFGFLLFKYPPFQSVLVFFLLDFFLGGNMLVRNNAGSCPFQALDRPTSATASSTALEPRSFRIITPDALLEPFLFSSTRESL